jgi:hypothetical protein
MANELAIVAAIPNNISDHLRGLLPQIMAQR